MKSKSNVDELSVQALEQLLLEKRRQRTEQTLRRVAGVEQSLSQDGGGLGERNTARSPELWRGAHGQNRYFRTIEIRPIQGIGGATPLSPARPVGSQWAIWRRRILLAVEVALVAGFALIMGKAYLDMMRLNESMATLLSGPSPTSLVRDEIATTATPTASAPTITAVPVQDNSLEPTVTPMGRPTATALPLLPGAPQPATRPSVMDLPDTQPTSVEAESSPTATSKAEVVILEGDTRACLVISHINVNAPIVQGDTWEDLKQGVGTHEGSVAPGQAGNLVLSAHNDVYGEIFRDLHKLEPGDTVTVHWEQDIYTYRVRQVEIVEPTRIDLIEQTEEPILTLITCYPYLLDTHRVIVIADLVQ